MWKRQFQERPNSSFPGEGRKRAAETQVAELERKVGQQTMEIDFLKGLLATDRGSAEVRRRRQPIRSLPEDPARMERGSPLTTARMTALAGVSRATYYRFDPEAKPAVSDTELRDAIQRIALRFPAYGRPRITAELKRQGWKANHKRVGRILREDNLLCLRKKKFNATKDSEHGFAVYP